MTTTTPKIVRYASGRGLYCHELGPLLRETHLVYIYRTREGGQAAIPKRLAHCMPCEHCAEPAYRDFELC